jgi:modulator of FtsH protease
MQTNLNNDFGRGMLESTTVDVAQQNAVLRNTYMLLAVSLVPTIFGAILGVSLNLKLFSGWMGILLFLGIAFGFFYAIEKTKHTKMGVFLLLGFTFFMGIALSALLQRTLGFKNGATLIALAGGATAATFFAMSALAATIKRDISGMGKFLFIGMILLIVASIANIFFKIPALQIGIMIIAVGLFTAYLLYDIKQIIDGGETNYVSATLSIYLDLYNIFSNLLALFGIIGGDRD